MAWLIAFGIVAAFAVFGALIAGDPEAGPYADLVQPWFSPPLSVWIAIAAAYYAIMIVIVARLWPTRSAHRSAFTSVLAILLANELWNVFLFRLGNPEVAFWALFPFTLLVVVSLVFIRRIDRLSGALLTGYTVWLIFDLVWAWHLSALN